MLSRSRRATAFAGALTAMLVLGTTSQASADTATTICVADIAWACVYSDGGYWCHKVYGGSNWTSYCVGATGVRICTFMYPGPAECDSTPFQ